MAPMLDKQGFLCVQAHADKVYTNSDFPKDKISRNCFKTQRNSKHKFDF